MDNTDKKKRVVLVQKTYNRKTGESLTKVRPKPVVKNRMVLVKGKGKKTVGNIITARLRPLRFAMVSGLKKLGYDTSKLNFRTLIAKYYNEYATGNKSRKLNKLNVSDFVNNIAFKLEPDDDVIGDIADARNRQGFTELTTIVDEVINLFKVSKAKYDTALLQGYDPEKVLRDEELTQAKAAILVEKNLMKKDKQDNFFKSTDIRNLIVTIVGTIIAAYLIKKVL